MNFIWFWTGAAIFSVIGFVGGTAWGNVYVRARMDGDMLKEYDRIIAGDRKKKSQGKTHGK